MSFYHLTHSQTSFSVVLTIIDCIANNSSLDLSVDFVSSEVSSLIFDTNSITSL